MRDFPPPQFNWRYILEDGLPLLEPDALKWARWVDEHRDECQVAHTDFPGGCYVSTVFLCQDALIGRGGRPVLYESMIFGGDLDGASWRYTSREDALVGHNLLVRHVERVVNLIGEVNAIGASADP